MRYQHHTMKPVTVTALAEAGVHQIVRLKGAATPLEPDRLASKHAMHVH